MITKDDIEAAIPELTRQQFFLGDLLRRGAEVVQEQPYPNIGTTTLTKEITLNMQRGAEKNHTNHLMNEIENGIGIVEKALDRARLILRARPEIYTDAEADIAVADILAHQNIAQSFLTQIGNLSEEDLSRLNEAEPDGALRLPLVQQRTAAARYDFERVTDYIVSSAQAGTTSNQGQEAQYFDYASALPENPRESYIDGCLELAKLFTKAVEHTSRRMDDLLDLLDLNRMGFIALQIIPEDEALVQRVELQREYKAANENVLKTLDITKGYFIQALNFTEQQP